MSPSAIRGGAGDNPRFLALGDRSQLHIEINPVEAETGTYKLDVNLKGPVTGALDRRLAEPSHREGQEDDLVLPLTGAGLGMVRLNSPSTAAGITSRRPCACG